MKAYKIKEDHEGLKRGDVVYVMQRHKGFARVWNATKKHLFHGVPVSVIGDAGRSFEAVSFHIVKPCNMRCKFCYATYDDIHITNQMPLADACKIIKKLYIAGVKKITFAGGEPMLYKYLDDVIIYSKSIGMTTSIITNGSFITDQWLNQMANVLDWIGISIDSLNPDTNSTIGRTWKSPIDYFKLTDAINYYGYKLKINTVVNAYNHDENLVNFIELVKPSRWKVFQALPVAGQNDKHFEKIKVSDEQFAEFCKRNNHKSMIIENNEAMRGSYLLIDPLGRLFESTNGGHTYSDSLLNKSMAHCLSQINIYYDRFIGRGGLYKW